MREIKFRMWNGVPSDRTKERHIYTVYDVMTCLTQQLEFNEKQGGYNHIGDGSAFEQFTGLKDKNGKEIYEGDIDKNSKNVVLWYKERACFGLFDENGNIMSYPLSDSQLKIIGNIHENKELIK